jgi:hypothetical protein
VHLRDPQNTGRPMFTDVPTPPTAGRAGERESGERRRKLHRKGREFAEEMKFTAKDAKEEEVQQLLSPFAIRHETRCRGPTLR